MLLSRSLLNDAEFVSGTIVNPQDGAAFNQGMTDLAYLLARAVLLAYDFSGIATIVDLGAEKVSCCEASWNSIRERGEQSSICRTIVAHHDAPQRMQSGSRTCQETSLIRFPSEPTSTFCVAFSTTGATTLPGSFSEIAVRRW